MVVLFVKEVGFFVIYLFGVVYIVSRGFFDLGIIMLIEMVDWVKDFVCVVDLFLFVDIDMGFGGVLNVVWIVCEMFEVRVVVV